MEKLLQVFNNSEIEYLLNVNPSIKDITEEEIDFSFSILNSYDISNDRLKNIIMSNPNYLSCDKSDLDKMFSFLISKGVSNIGIIIDTYPGILDKNLFEIECFYNKKMNNGLSIFEINELIESDPFCLDE